MTDPLAPPLIRRRVGSCRTGASIAGSSALDPDLLAASGTAHQISSTDPDRYVVYGAADPALRDLRVTGPGIDERATVSDDALTVNVEIDPSEYRDPTALERARQTLPSRRR